MNVDPNLVVGPFVVICLGIAMFAWLAMLGGSLKVSLGMTTQESPGYLRCLVMALLIIAINIGVTIGLHLLLGQQPLYIIACYQLILQTVMVAMIARCNPISAFFASIIHSVFSCMGTVAIAIALFLVVGTSLVGLQERGGELFGEKSTTAEKVDAPSVPSNGFATPVSHPSAPGAQTNPFVK